MTNTATLTPMIVLVTSRSSASAKDRCGAHSGQRNPTGVERMQSAQIGRSQLEQRTAVGRLRWR